jgi:hypothetical protein
MGRHPAINFHRRRNCGGFLGVLEKFCVLFNLHNTYVRADNCLDATEMILSEQTTLDDASNA